MAIYLSIHLSIDLSIDRSIYLSIFLSFYIQFQFTMADGRDRAADGREGSTICWERELGATICLDPHLLNWQHDEPL